jgi:hypothetical protein
MFLQLFKPLGRRADLFRQAAPLAFQFRNLASQGLVFGLQPMA